MSTQKGNSNRSRPQKYKNQTAFKNDLHDKSLKTKIINNIEIANVCERCKQIIEWKIKYKKYKPLRTPAKCIKCDQKSVKHSYHNICTPCAKQNKVCSKCGSGSNIFEEKPSREESIKLDAELQNLLKELPERKRRTFIRYMNRNATNKNCNSGRSKNQTKKYEDEGNETTEESKDQSVVEPVSKDDMLLKLKSLIIKNEDDNDDEFDDDDNWDSDSFT
ncbi:uncharacterized protein C9orf85 homolog [Nomia melanderi]|uniref:uncharacterized protein C9orf85 homolog n=1 Tax=Nomia melanderi TaxID=2448451 RepID=UPI00130459CF|nr:uncharacterized protein C9orf85 homolog [Nomia melanderi]